MNLWDKVIVFEDIVEFFKVCEKGNGNVKIWVDFYDLVKVENVILVIFLVCCVS